MHARERSLFAAVGEGTHYISGLYMSTRFMYEAGVHTNLRAQACTDISTDEPVHTNLYVGACTHKSVHTYLYLRAWTYKSALYVRACAHEPVHTNL